MRAICLALLAINLLVFGAQFLMESPGPPADSGPSPTVETQGNLRLLSERSGSETASTTRSAAAEPPSPGTGLDNQPICTLVGPFAETEAAEDLLERLSSLDVQGRIEGVEVPDGTGYWVYLPPELSHKAALRRLHELQAKNIDSYIIPRGELAKGISLGMFSQAELARQRREELVALGYDAQIEEISRTHREIWVSLPLSQAARVADGFWLELLNDQPDLEKRQNFCPGVASGPKFH